MKLTREKLNMNCYQIRTKKHSTLLLGPIDECFESNETFDKFYQKERFNYEFDFNNDEGDIFTRDNMLYYIRLHSYYKNECIYEIYTGHTRQKFHVQIDDEHLNELFEIIDVHEVNKYFYKKHV